MDDKQFHVYIMTNWKHNVLYVGITSNFLKRVYEHKNYIIEGFTHKYNCTKLVYFESTVSAYEAISREKQIKGWRRDEKVVLINSKNSEWLDLSKGWC